MARTKLTLTQRRKVRYAQKIGNDRAADAMQWLYRCEAKEKAARRQFDRITARLIDRLVKAVRQTKAAHAEVLRLTGTSTLVRDLFHAPE